MSSQHTWNCNVSVCYDLHATLSSSFNSNVKLKIQLSLHRPGQALEGSKSLRLPQLPRKSAHEGGKASSSTHRPPLSPGDILVTHFCDKQTSLYWSNILCYKLEYVWVWGSESRVKEGTQHAKEVKPSWLKAEVNGWLICQNDLQKFYQLKCNGKSVLKIGPTTNKFHVGTYSGATASCLPRQEFPILLCSLNVQKQVHWCPPS